LTASNRGWLAPGLLRQKSRKCSSPARQPIVKSLVGPAPDEMSFRKEVRMTSGELKGPLLLDRDGQRRQEHSITAQRDASSVPDDVFVSQPKSVTPGKLQSGLLDRSSIST